MRYIRFFDIFLLLSITSCGTQEPAPIDYRSGISSYSTSKSDGESISSKKFDIKIEENKDIEEKSENENHVLKDKNPQKFTKKYVTEEEKEPEEERKIVAKQPVEPPQKNKDEDDLESELGKIENTKPQDQETEKEPLAQKEDIEHTQTTEKADNDNIAPNELFIYPVSGKIITNFGEVVSGSKNSGINFECHVGEKVIASANGKVIHIAKDPKYGNIVIISHPNNLQTAYAHLDSVEVSKGQEVAKGSEIGIAGKTGDAEKIMLHFAVREGKIAVDPLKYLKNR